MKSEVDSEENEEFQDSNDGRNALTCFCCNFETVNIDELDEHILVNHEDDEAENPDQKFEIVTEEEDSESVSNPRKRHLLEKAVVRALGKSIPRGKIIIRPHDTKFQLCKDTKFSLVNDDESPRPKRAKRTPAEEMNCHLCDFVTRKKSVLATHMLNHSDVIPPVYYKCSQCPYQTKRKNDMPKHMLGHCTNVLLYKCSECSYETKRKNDLPKHVLCHKPPDSVPLYKCKYCPYVTKRRGDLPKHEMNHVERDKVFSWNCTECEYSSKRKNDLHKHMLVHSDRQLTGVFKCLKCAYASDKIVKFSRHVLSKCKVWDEPISLEHLMLEDILASVDKNGVHVVLDTDSDGDVHVEGERVQYVEGERVQYVEAEEGVEFIEFVEGGEETEEGVIVEGEIITDDYIQTESNEDVAEVQPIQQVKQECET